MIEYNIDDVVLIKTYMLADKSKRVHKKLVFKYSEPYKVIGKKSLNTYLLQKLDHPLDIKEAHVTKMKKYRTPRS